jgi:hypothetical protein
MHYLFTKTEKSNFLKNKTMNNFPIKTILAIVTFFSVSSCDNISKEVENKVNELKNKTESLDSVIKKETDKVLTLDSLINGESEKVKKLDSLINKNSSKIDSISSKNIKKLF